MVLLPKDHADEPSEGQLFIKLQNPSLGLAQICKLLESKLYPRVQPGIHSTAFVEKSAEIDESVSLWELLAMLERRLNREKLQNKYSLSYRR